MRLITIKITSAEQIDELAGCLQKYSTNANRADLAVIKKILSHPEATNFNGVVIDSYNTDIRLVNVNDPELKTEFYTGIFEPSEMDAALSNFFQ